MYNMLEVVAFVFCALFVRQRIQGYDDIGEC